MVVCVYDAGMIISYLWSATSYCARLSLMVIPVLVDV